MSITPSEFYDLDEKQLLESMGGAQVNSARAYAIESEFRRRALMAQIEAAESTKETAKWTRYSAIAIALSVFVMAVGTFIP